MSIINHCSPPVEGRSDLRHIATLRVGVLHYNNVQSLCLVKNISAGGLMARIYQDAEPGDHIKIEFKSEHLLEGIITWKNAEEVGVQFYQPIDLVGVLAGEWLGRASMQARTPRIELSCPLNFRIGAIFYTGTVCDISQGGAKILLGKPITNEGGAMFNIPGLPPLAGAIRWQRDNLAGISFNESVSIDVLVRWIKARRLGERGAVPPVCESAEEG